MDVGKKGAGTTWLQAVGAGDPGRVGKESDMVRESGPTRRGVLAGVAALALPSLAMPGVARGAAPGPCDWCAPSPAAWRELAAHAQVIRPGEAGFLARSVPQNLRYRRVQPRAIARCRTAEGVAGVIAWCRDHDIPFAIRGGGHSYAGLSTSAGLLLDTSPMAAVRGDVQAGTVEVGAGARNGDVAQGLRGLGRTIMHGRCPTVGIAGFLLGGGIGFNMRRFGIGSDLMVAAELVTADGQIRTVSATREPALFWALRGGAGGNFGVATRFTLTTHPADPVVTVFALRWQGATQRTAEAYVAAAEAAPETFGSRFALRVSGPQTRARRLVALDVVGQFAGPRQGLMDILGPVLAVAKPDREAIEERAYWEGQAFLSDPGEPGFYQERSGFVRGGIGAQVLDCGFTWLGRWPGAGARADLRFFHTGGAVNRVAADATAFVHRDSAWLFSMGMDWGAGDQASGAVMGAAHRWQDGFYAEMRALCGGAAYQNFPDPSLADWRQAYYGANLARLEKVKAAVDPHAVFRHAQAI